MLLDEIEKAHPQALHLLLQLFDEGRLTDAAGEVASFASAVVIMTSNLGSRSAQPIGFGDARDRILADVARAVREFFPVELFNRIDQRRAVRAAHARGRGEGRRQGARASCSRAAACASATRSSTPAPPSASARSRDAFDPRYGARTVKRWLEDHVGGSLTDLLAAAPPARLRIVRLAEERRHDRARRSSRWPERAPVPGRYVLEGALDLATAALEPPPPRPPPRSRASARRRSARARATRRTDDLRYYVDELEQRLDRARAAARRARPPRAKRARGRAIERRRGTDRGDTRREGRVRTRGPTRGRPPAGRDALIAAIAEALLIERALPTLLDPDAHAVTIILSRIGARPRPSGLGRACRSRRRRAGRRRRGGSTDGAATSTEAAAAVAARHESRTGRGRQIRSEARADDWRVGAARDVALVLRGLFVRAALAHDHGTWMLRAHGAEPDVMRVEVRPGAPATPEDVLRAHRRGRAALERALEEGGALPPNPDVLLPVTRTLTFARRRARRRARTSVEIEDFATGWVDRGDGARPRRRDPPRLAPGVEPRGARDDAAVVPRVRHAATTAG